MNIAVNCNKIERRVSAIIVAAGTSSRMHGIDKQLLEIGGMPVIARAVSAFDKSEIISEVVIVTREDLIDKISLLTEKYNFNKVKAVVKGGDTRQISVFNGIAACSDDAEFIAVHDGARPFVTQDVIRNTVSAAFKSGAAAAAVTANDTVKIADENNKIINTVDRDTVRLMQTPQVFEKNAYISAMNNVPDSEKFTDDCMLMEKAGKSVLTVPSSPLNIKITTREDIVFAEAVLRSMKND